MRDNNGIDDLYQSCLQSKEESSSQDNSKNDKIEAKLQSKNSLNQKSLALLNNSVIHSQDLGVIVFDSQYNVCLWNSWIENLSAVSKKDAIGRKLNKIFPNFDSKRFETAVENAIKGGLSSILSQVFNPYPLPLYKDVNAKENENRIHQQINVKHVRIEERSFAIVEVRNVTATVVKEQLLKNQTKELKKASEESTIQRNYIQSILDSSSEAILTVSASGVVKSYNRSVCEIFELAGSEVKGKLITLFVPEFRIVDFHSNDEPRILRGQTASQGAIDLDVLCSPLADGKQDASPARSTS